MASLHFCIEIKHFASPQLKIVRQSNNCPPYDESHLICVILKKHTSLLVGQSNTQKLLKPRLDTQDLSQEKKIKKKFGRYPPYRYQAM